MEPAEGREAADLMEMAATAEREDNYVEALACYDRVLEIDPDRSEAWFARGRITGWQSTVSNVRIREALVAFGHAIATAAEDRILAVAALAQADMVSISTVIYGMARKDFLSHGAVASARQRYVKTSCALSDMLEEVVIWNPADRATLEHKALIAKDLLNLGVSAELAVVMQRRMAAANFVIASLDVSYREPVLAAKTSAQIDSRRSTTNVFGYFMGFVFMIASVIVAAMFRR